MDCAANLRRLVRPDRICRQDHTELFSDVTFCLHIYPGIYRHLYAGVPRGLGLSRPKLGALLQRL